MNNVRVEKIGSNTFRVLLEVPLGSQWFDEVQFNCFNSKDYFWLS